MLVLLNTLRTPRRRRHAAHRGVHGDRAARVRRKGEGLTQVGKQTTKGGFAKPKAELGFGTCVAALCAACACSVQQAAMAKPQACCCCCAALWRSPALLLCHQLALPPAAPSSRLCSDRAAQLHKGGPVSQQPRPVPGQQGVGGACTRCCCTSRHTIIIF